MTRGPPVIRPPLFVERHKAAGRKELARHAKAIRELRQRTARDIIKIGQHLIAAHEACGPRNWSAWLDQQFGWSDQTASNFMNVSRMASAKRIWHIDLPLRSFYLLAPAALRDEVLDQAESGEPPTYDDIKEAIADEVEPPKTHTALPAPAPAPEPAPASQDAILFQIGKLFGRLDQQQRVDSVVQLYLLLGRHEQQQCFLKLRQIAAGSA